MVIDKIALQRAYEQARYLIYLPQDWPAGVLGQQISINLGVQSEPVQTLLEQLQTQTAALITAFNPMSQQSTALDNQQRQDQLRTRARQLGYEFLEGSNQDPTGHWPDEPSILILSIGLSQATEIATEFEQAAFLYVSEHRNELIWAI